MTETSRRRYDDACATAHAMDLIGERWALLVMRELMFGPKRFSDLRADLPGISANVLTQRLEGLEAAGIVVRRRLPPPTPVQLYELTPWGAEAEPIFQALGRWAARSPLHDPTLPFSASSLFLSFRTMFDAERAAGLSALIGFRIGKERFLVRIEDGRLTAERRPFDTADAAFAGTAQRIAAVVYGGVPMAGMVDSGMLAVDGDRALAERFTRLFPLPDKADPGRAAGMEVVGS
jgi:DNA-binding HxlR family transcriptional regulator